MGALTTTAATVYRDYNTVNIPASGVRRPPKSEIRSLFADIDTAITAFGVTPAMYGAMTDGSQTATQTAGYIQTAIDALHALYLADGMRRVLWFDKIYTIGGPKHANGYSILDWKSGVSLLGPGGLKLADNTNVAEAVFSATFSGSQMTLVSFTSGAITASMFLSGSGLAADTQEVSLASGSANTAGAVYNVNTVNTIASPVTIKGIARMVEMLGAYNSTSNVLTSVECGIVLDYNGANNCASQTIWSFNAVISVQTGSNISFRGAHFQNNPGSNTLVLGTYQATPTLSNVLIDGCVFENDGDAINSASGDYSTVFAVVDGLRITGNHFSNGPQVNGAAWEIYGTNIDISGNTVWKYFTAANVVAIANQTTRNVNISGNTINKCSAGFTLWTLASTSKLQNINIKDNVLFANVSAPGGPYLVNGSGLVTTGSELQGINIEGNTWLNTDLSDVARPAAGISLKAVLSAKISGNFISGIPGPGIYITVTGNPVALDITNNSLINTGYCNTSALKTGISLDASGSTGSLLISGNLIHPLSGYTLTTGINNALSVDNGSIDNNLILSSTAAIANTGTNVICGAPTGVGYGSGGAVTQATSKSTGVTLNRYSGAITLNNAALASGAAASFTLTNSAIAATDTVSVSIKSGATAGAYRVLVDAVANGSCQISVTNGSGGSLSEAIVINFNVIKGYVTG